MAVLSLGTAAVNMIVDPYDLYRIVDSRVFNHYKPEKYQRVRLLKAFAVEAVRPRAIVLGTSRSHIGIRMSGSAWPADTMPRYNLAFDGATTHEMYAYLLHVHSIQPPKLVVLGLDTWQLGTAPSGVRPDFDATLLDEPGRWTAHVQSHLARLRVAFSLDALFASVRTIGAQGAAAEDWFADDGQRLGEMFFHRPGEKFSDAGQGTYFADVDREEAGFKLDMGPPARPRPGTVLPQADFSSLDYVRKIVAFCRTNNIDLRLFITPAHAHQNEISAATGEWNKIEAGKRALVQMLVQDSEEAGAEPFPLWDFSGYSSVTTETVPSRGEQREMAYYWDSSHFKEIVGDWVMERVFGTANPVHSAPSDFGVRLTAATVEMELEKIRADRGEYRRSHVDGVRAIEAMVTAVYRAIPPERRVPITGVQ